MTKPSVQIEAIAYALPNQVLSNERLQAEHPDWDFDHLEARTGVFSRHIASPGETALDFALAACRDLESQGHDLATTIGAIIFCTETPDHKIPPNANILHGLLNMERDVIAFDITAGCSGYLYGLELARAMIVGEACERVLLVTGDTYSHLINPGDRACRCLFGDGAAVSLIGKAAPQTGILDCLLGTSGKEYDRFMVPAGGARLPSSEKSGQEIIDRSGNIRSQNDIEMSGFGVLSFFNSVIPKEVDNVLTRNDLSTDDIDLFVFHQASAVALDTLQRVLQIPDKKMAREFSDTGNLVSASVPVTLKRCHDKGLVAPGALVLLCGFGVGMSWGTALLRAPGDQNDR